MICQSRINWERRDRNAAIPFFESQLRSDGLQRCRKFFYESIVKNMALSTQHEIVSTHTRPVNCLALERQDNQFLLSGGLDGLVAIYDLNVSDNGRTEGQRQSAKSIFMASNSLRSSGGNVANFGSTTGPTLSVAISSVNWYPLDSGIFATTDYDGNLNIWDTNEFTVVGNFILRSKIFNAKFKDDGSLIAVALGDQSIRLCDPSSGDCTHVLSGHSAGVVCVEWSPSEEFVLASASWDGKIKLWDVRKGSYDAALLSFDWQQDHTAKAEYSVQQQDENSSPSKTAQNIHQDITYYTPHTQHSSCSRGKTDDYVSSSERAAHGFVERNRMKKFDWTRDQLAKAHESSGVTSILYSPCGRYLVSSGNDRKVRLWSSNNGYLHGTNYGIKCTSNLPFSMAIISDFSSSGDDVLVYPNGDKGEIALVALHSPTGVPFARLKGHLGAVTSLVYRNKHCQIISAGKDGMIHIWDSSLADKEREIENRRRHDMEGAGVRGYYEGDDSAIEIENQNDDNWSDDDENEGRTIYDDSNSNDNSVFRFDNDNSNRSGNSKGQKQIPQTPSRPKGYFIPPIVQRYLDDAAAAKKKLIVEQRRVVMERAEVASAAAAARASKKVRLHESDTAVLRAHRGSSTNVAHKLGKEATKGIISGAPAYRKGRNAPVGKIKMKEKSHKERAEVIFAINAAAALRTVATNFPCSSSIIVEESSSARSDNVTTVSAPAVTSVTPNDCIHEGSSTTFREKEKEKEGTKSKKSTLSLLRLKYSSANKKNRG